MIKRTIFKRFLKDQKVVENCETCNKKLAKNSVHHFKCHSCWTKEKIKQGVSKKDLKRLRKHKFD